MSPCLYPSILISQPILTSIPIAPNPTHISLYQFARAGSSASASGGNAEVVPSIQGGAAVVVALGDQPTQARLVDRVALSDQHDDDDDDGERGQL